MKLIRLATVAALTTTILAGGAASAFADEVRDVTSNGQIEFTPSEDEELEVIPPEQGPDGPDVDIEVEVPGTTGPLSIVKVAHMDFGSQVISNQDQVYNMVAEMQPLRETGELVPYTSFAQVQDVRGNNAGWDLQVSMSEFTSNTQNNVLTGAEIEFVDSRIQYEGINQENAPSNHAAGLVLSPNNAGVSVMTAETGQGAGASSVVWGDQADLNAQFADEEIEVVENDMIRLSVPGSTAKDATTYTSTLNWELTTTPGANAGEAI
ncbi:WxL domain-containing protein [Enterococcus casseliflavus]|nr:WxL domain-containing protein [Enterococcus casseliflavus]